jgi:ABC-type nitrate/sulfonate/bicarbonate transport system substrate-binding protein
MTSRVAWALLLVGVVTGARAAPGLAVFIAEGAMSPADTAALLVARVGAALGEAVEPRAAHSALQHWTALRAGDGALVAVESVQFGAWRVRHQGYRVLAVSERTVSYSVVARPGVTVLEADDLAGLRIAVTAPPSLPALQLLALFPDPLRAPRLMQVGELGEGLALLRRGLVDAAVLTEPMSRAATDVREVLTLEETPVAVVCVAAVAGPELSRRLQQTLPVAPAGRGLPPLPATGAFLPPGEDELARFAALLSGTWGASP